MQYPKIPGWPFYGVALAILFLSALSAIAFRGAKSEQPLGLAASEAVILAKPVQAAPFSPKIWWMEQQVAGGCTSFLLEHRLPGDRAGEHKAALLVEDAQEARELARHAEKLGLRVFLHRLEATPSTDLEGFPGSVITLAADGIRLPVAPDEQASARVWLKTMRELGRPVPTPGVPGLWAAAIQCK